MKPPKESIEYLDFLEKEVIAILIHNKMFKEVTEIIQKNPAINKKNSFFDWMVSAYVSDITIRIRRLVDEDAKVKSFVNFLNDLQINSIVRSRAYHLDFYKENFVLEEIGNRTFDGLAGIGASEYGVELIQKDIDDLKNECLKIVIFTHNYIAHTNAKIIDRGGSSNVTNPTFADLDNAMKHIDKLLIKYFLLVKAVGKEPSLMPHWQYNWQSIFEVPWIQK